ncbi:hypothetical protein GCM10007933_21940 [Zoogloea oryzae]|uniref:Uncharacterized protein n=1 Tax=Zoogloea oryzae TaxID=310767 RepID=A0ABQ6FBT6_9RHOO|nr:hypothetical protein [Zoogloea oryzae]GLT22734.1 hypothetical protein GCM10007933_21940 [Zoogloea oryzae]
MTNDDEPDPQNKNAALSLSKERADELKRASTALLHWMAEQIVNELIEESQQVRTPGDEALESATTSKLQKTVVERPRTPPRTSQPTHPGTVPPRWKPESET